jgi:hypothetical protein
MRGRWGINARARAIGAGATAAVLATSGLVLATVQRAAAAERPAETISVPLSGDLDGTAFRPAVSDNGNIVAFQSSATNLVANDANGSTDVFVRNRAAGTTQLVSVDSAGNQGDESSDGTSISGGGRYIAFDSNATNFSGGPGGNVYVRDLQTNTTDLVSVAGQLPANSQNFYGDISSDGEHVAFLSNSPAGVHVYERDQASGAMTEIDVNTSGQPSAGPIQTSGNERPAVSADGRFVAFGSDASDLVPGDDNGVTDVFVRDTVLGTTTRVSVDSNGNQADGRSVYPVISDDGRYVSFTSESDNLVGGSLFKEDRIYVHDMQTGTTTLVSAPHSSSVFSDLSPDGRYVTYWSDNAGDSEIPGVGQSIVVVRDLQNSTEELVATGTDPEMPSTSADGGVVAYSTHAVVYAGSRGSNGGTVTGTAQCNLSIGGITSVNYTVQAIVPDAVNSGDSYDVIIPSRTIPLPVSNPPLTQYSNITTTYAFESDGLPATITGADAGPATFNGASTPFTTSVNGDHVTLTTPGPLVLGGHDGTLVTPDVTVHITAPSGNATITTVPIQGTSTFLTDSTSITVTCPLPSTGISSTTVTSSSPPTTTTTTAPATTSTSTTTTVAGGSTTTTTTVPNPPGTNGDPVTRNANCSVSTTAGTSFAPQSFVVQAVVPDSVNASSEYDVTIPARSTLLPGVSGGATFAQYSQLAETYEFASNSDPVQITRVTAPTTADFNGNAVAFSTVNTATTVTQQVPGPLVVNGADGTVTLPAVTVHLTAPAFAATITSFADSASDIAVIEGVGNANINCAIDHIGISTTTINGPAKPPPPPAQITATPNTGLHNGDTVTVNGQNFHALAGVMECNSDLSQPVVAYTSVFLPVSCTDPAAHIVTPGGPVNSFTTPVVVKTGTVGPPIGAIDSMGNPAAVDAANYPCPPTPAEQAAGVTCEILVGDLALEVAAAPIVFAGQPQAPSATLSTPAANDYFVQGQSVNADYACSESPGPATLSSCVGTLTDGAAINTSTPGTYLFDVLATDSNNKQVIVEHSYTVIAPVSAAGTQDANEFLSTDTGSTGATPDAPVQTAVASPTGGDISIAQGAVSQSDPTGFSLLNIQENITAPPASADQPLVLKFSLDAALLAAAGVNASTVQVFRNGTAVADCDDPGTAAAAPDPCVFARTSLPGGDAELDVYSSHASQWNFGSSNTPVGPHVDSFLVPGGTVGAPYSTTLSASGGTAPYAWSVQSGSLPAGLTLNAATGAVTGVPTAAGTTSFTVRATDAKSHTATATLSITVAATPDRTKATLGVPYWAAIAPFNGTAPYHWSVSGKLPAGLTLDPATGVLAGTPTTEGMYKFNVVVADSASKVKKVTTKLTVAVAPVAITVAPSSLLNEAHGVPFTVKLTASGGAAPYKFKVTAGALPKGVGMSGSGTLSGKPAAAGTYDFAVTVTDHAKFTATRDYTLTVT